MKFTKMHGAGNDYIYVDCFDGAIPENVPALAQQVSDRHFGIGADGLILIAPSDHADARMRMYNADGSEAEMCGNGIRCFAKFLYDHDLVRKKTLEVETGAGVLSLELFTDNGTVNQVRVDMGEPILDGPAIPTTISGNPVVDQPISVEGTKLNVTCVSMGNPHCVTYVEDTTDELVLGLGPKIETSDYFPNRVNVEFIRIASPTEVYQRTWERGSGETFACGTGASAVCVAGVLGNRTERKVRVHLLGGDLDLHWDASTNHVFMTGPAVEVFSGEWPDA